MDREQGTGRLRRRAEDRLRASRRGEPQGAEPDDQLRLVHELQVHQVELELQNEELRRARDEAEASASRFRELYDFAPVGYLTLDGRGTVLEANLGGATLLGAERPALVGQRLEAWLSLESRAELQRFLETLRREERASCELTLATAPRSPLHVRVDGQAVPSPRPEAWCCHAALTDVTAHRAAAELRESDRRKSEFIALLSHELRNPLAPITSAIRLLGSAPGLAPEARQAVAIIERQTRHLTRLVNDLLDLTRIAKGMVELRPELVDLRELARQAGDDHRAVFEQRGIALRLLVPAGPTFVRGDPTRLAQVVGNLLQNAAKFTPAPGVTDLEVGVQGDRARIRVRDSGIGIAPGQLARLFVPFAQVEEGLARSHGGLGLGLSLVKGLVELHGGTLAGHSEGLGRGAEFLVSLPLAVAPAEARPVASRPVPSRSIVIVEDNEDAAWSLAAVLSLDGHHVEVARDGRSGIELVRRVRPDVVFCDIGLPDLNGYEVASALKADELRPKPRLVALSGYAEPEDQERARLAGFDAHLAKPPDLAAVNALLGREA